MEFMIIPDAVMVTGAAAGLFFTALSAGSLIRLRVLFSGRR